MPDTTACYAEKFGQCAADGMGVSDVAEDCAANNQVCAASGCASTATDTMGANDEVRIPNNQVIGNFINVHTPRSLSSIEAYLELPASRTVRWLVYEKQATPTYYVSYQLKFDKVTLASGTGFQSSGAMNFKLEANKTYLVGLQITTGSYVAYWARIQKSHALSFGVATASTTTFFVTSGALYPTPGELYYMRFVTSLP
jgi:hypothetical protein